MALQHAETSAPTATVRHCHAAPVPLWRSRDLRAWEAAASWLAELHVAPVPVDGGDLQRHDAAHLHRLFDRALTTYGPAVVPLAAGFEAAVARLSHRPAGLVNGAFYASNVLVDRSLEDEPRIRVLRWDAAGIGCGLLDLAALLSGSWTREDRTHVAAAYARALPVGMRPSVRDLILGLEDALTVLSVQWLAWAPEEPVLAERLRAAVEL